MKRDNNYLMGNQHAKDSKPNKTAFKKGNTPWNKGLKGIHLSPKTEFKKGHKNTNWLPIGATRIRLCKGNPRKQRQYIKIEEPNKWIEYAKIVWIKYNGKIPKGFLIHHLDCNTLNDNINNLALLTRKAHFEIHGIGELGRKKKAENYANKINS